MEIGIALQRPSPEHRPKSHRSSLHEQNGHIFGPNGLGPGAEAGDVKLSMSPNQVTEDISRHFEEAPEFVVIDLDPESASEVVDVSATALMTPQEISYQQPIADLDDITANLLDSEVASIKEFDDSDDDIAVLTKEEAEKIGKFKSTSFESSSFNKPAPVAHAGSHNHNNPFSAERRRELALRDYFARYSHEELQSHKERLEEQLQRQSDDVNEYQSSLNLISVRLRDLRDLQTDQRNSMVRSSYEFVELINKGVAQSSETRKNIAILESVIASRFIPQIEMGNSSENNGSDDIYEIPGPYSNYNPYMQYAAPQIDPDMLAIRSLMDGVLAELSKEDMAPTPQELTITLLDHQKIGLHWLLAREKTNSGSILADDMGLGKTIQALSLIIANKSVDPDCKTTLIVGPVSLLLQWESELKQKVRPEHRLKVALYHGNDKKRLSSFSSFKNYDVIMTSYMTLASEWKKHYNEVLQEAQVNKRQNLIPDFDSGGRKYKSPFFGREALFYRIILDEAQFIKGKLSQSSKAAACLRAKLRLCLSGTPFQNNIDELYPLLRFLRTRPYDEEVKFKRDISIPLKSANNDGGYLANRSMKKLHALLLAIMLRRKKNSIINGKKILDLPEKTVESMTIGMADHELEEYKDLEKGIQQKAAKLLSSATMKHTSILALLLRLRQACIHMHMVRLGDMNKQEKSGLWNGMMWYDMFHSLEEMSREARGIAISSIEKGENVLQGDPDAASLVFSDSDVQFECPSCLNIVGHTSLIVSTRCGHFMCDECVLEVVNSDEGEGIASCVSCRASLSGNTVATFEMFEKVAVRALSFEYLEQHFQSSRRPRTSNREKIETIISTEGGLTLSAKFRKTIELIEKITAASETEKIIIFSNFTTTFDLMRYALEKEDYAHLRYDGSMTISEKNATVTKFYEGSERILLVSMKAGNVGLTLTCANHVIILDPFWNPFVEDQAMDRAHRLGQQLPVQVRRILVKESVEDRIMDLQVRKRELVEAALDDTELKRTSRLNRTELGYLFGLNSLDRAT